MTVGLNKPTKSIFFDENLDSEIDQVWAEAVTLWKAAETLWIGREMELVAKKVQEQHTEENSLVGMLEDYLEKEIPTDWYGRSKNYRISYITNNGDFNAVDEVKLMKRNKVCTAEVWCEMLNGDMKKFAPAESKKINTALSKLTDWVETEDKIQFGTDYGLQKAFVRKVDDDDDSIFD